MAEIKSYKKLTKGPLGLGKGLTITDDTFTDEDFNDVNKKKLKAALRVGLVKEINAVVETTDKANKLDNEVEVIQEKLEQMTKERDDAVAELKELKGGDEDAWLTMSEEELAKAYTIPELKVLIKDNFDGVNIGRRATEGALTKMLFDLITEVNKVELS